MKNELVREKVDALGYGITREPSLEVDLPPHNNDYLLSILTNEAKPSLMFFAFSEDVYKKAYDYICDGYSNMAEDLYISVIMHFFVRSYRFTDKPYYHYMLGDGMCTNTTNLSEDRLRRQLSHINTSITLIREFLAANKPDYVRYVDNLRLNILIGTMYQYGGASTDWPTLIHYLEILNTSKR